MNSQPDQSSFTTHFCHFFIATHQFWNADLELTQSDLLPQMLWEFGGFWTPWPASAYFLWCCHWKEACHSHPCSLSHLWTPERLHRPAHSIQAEPGGGGQQPAAVRSLGQRRVSAGGHASAPGLTGGPARHGLAAHLQAGQRQPRKQGDRVSAW